MTKLSLSKMPKTWFIDIDGVVFVHNSHLEGADVLIKDAKKFIDEIPTRDKIILLTARTRVYRQVTLDALARHGIRYNQVIFDLPKGERILINDTKPGGMTTAIAVNTKRDAFIKPEVTYSDSI